MATGCLTISSAPPAAAVGRTAENGKLSLISLGQGQEGPAERVLDKYIAEGGWVFLDNLHLMSEWAPKLERKLEEAAERAHQVGLGGSFPSTGCLGVGDANCRCTSSVLSPCVGAIRL